MLKFKKEDTVKITSGKDKSREGKIEKIDQKNKTAIIAGINIYKKHVKAALTADKKGGIFEIPRPLPFSKIALICPNCKKVTRVSFAITKDKKERICIKCKKKI
ncbi:50S ribosomal protein L24 [Candidatus Woesebacteria bacterium]|nr:50S ribosomal protein L24 [Candidatus Woesebacteria bacterium]QQG47792.1 MAG: 50S ribosomal protein L24 [Candidatus Woesebacteria bacterium]